ncbi:hypothetical protein M8J75_007395 [Diaphorina citri]|nr:hypothetical protein M8J75_007395 [Diaphorina citri]
MKILPLLAIIFVISAPGFTIGSPLPKGSASEDPAKPIGGPRGKIIDADNPAQLDRRGEKNEAVESKGSRNTSRDPEIPAKLSNRQRRGQWQSAHSDTSLNRRDINNQQQLYPQHYPGNKIQSDVEPNARQRIPLNKRDFDGQHTWPKNLHPLNKRDFNEQQFPKNPHPLNKETLQWATFPQEHSSFKKERL